MHHVREGIWEKLSVTHTVYQWKILTDTSKGSYLNNQKAQETILTSFTIRGMRMGTTTRKHSFIHPLEGPKFKSLDTVRQICGPDETRAYRNPPSSRVKKCGTRAGRVCSQGRVLTRQPQQQVFTKTWADQPPNNDVTCSLEETDNRETHSDTSCHTATTQGQTGHGWGQLSKTECTKPL